ncbi:Cadherin, partial [Aphelenchoides avenae]
VEAFDADGGVGGVTRFFVQGNPRFVITKEQCSNSRCTGLVTLNSTLDYETHPVEVFTILARDGAALTKRSNTARANITVHVLDEQDSPPVFLTTFDVPLRVLENIPSGSRIIKVAAEDGDRFALRKNAISYNIAPNDFFDIDSDSGWLSLKQALDRETCPTLNLSITAIEQDAMRMRSTMRVEIIVVDADDNVPTCAADNYTARIDRDSRTLIVDQPIVVSDADQGKNAVFDVSLVGEFSAAFNLYPTTIHGSGEVTVEIANFSVLEKTSAKEIPLQIHLVPQGDSTKQGVCVLTVMIDDERPSAGRDATSRPSVSTKKAETFKPWQYTAEVAENSPIGTRVLTINLPSTDVRGDTKFHLVVNHDGTQDDYPRSPLQLAADGSIVVAEAIDYEHTQALNISVYARTEGRSLLFALIYVNVIDINDEVPIFRLPKDFRVVVSDSSTAGEILDIPYALAVDADRSEEFSRVEYSMINYKDYYEISPESSEIRFLKSLALYPHSTMNLTIRATDNPKGKPSARNIAYGTVCVVVLRDRLVVSNQTADFLSRYPSRIDVYDDESVGSTLATAPALLLPQRQVELSVSGPAAELVELSRSSGELRLRKSLRSFASQTLCVQLQARMKSEVKAAQGLTDLPAAEKT